MHSERSANVSCFRCFDIVFPSADCSTCRRAGAVTWRGIKVSSCMCGEPSLCPGAALIILHMLTHLLPATALWAGEPIFPIVQRG